MQIVDGGVSTDPNDLAEQAKVGHADFIALSSYNGVALQFVADLMREMKSRNLNVPIFVGGRLNRIPDGSNTSLPVRRVERDFKDRRHRLHERGRYA